MTKTVIISEEQKKFIEEQEGILFEYYVQASQPRKDANILGNVQIWIYGNDRANFTPHCHVMLSDRSIEVEVSLIDFNIINTKNPKNANNDWSFFNQLKKPFFKWLRKISGGNTNKKNLFFLWDYNNQNNTLLDFVSSGNVGINDDELINYLNDRIEEDNAELV